MDFYHEVQSFLFGFCLKMLDIPDIPIQKQICEKMNFKIRDLFQIFRYYEGTPMHYSKTGGLFAPAAA